MIRATVLVLALLVGTPSFAQSVADEAEVHFQQGAAAYDGGKYEEALIHFMQSNRLSPNAFTAGNVGHSYVALRKFPEAYRWYAQALALDEGKNDVMVQAMSSIQNNVVLVSLTSTPPGANVYVNRKSLGSVAVTPATIALPAGEYTFIVEKEGHRSFTSEAQSLTKLGKKSEIAASLTPITGTVEIQGAAGVEVRMGAEDGALVCVVPCSAALPVGQQILYLRRDGFRSQPALAAVTEGATITIQADLSQITGSVAVDATERGALVEIDGVSVGFTPSVVPAVPAGKRVLKLSLRGYEPVEIEIDVPPEGQVVVPTVELVPVNEVTAVSRRSESVTLAPSSVTLISNDELRAFRYPTILEALRGVRGSSISSDSIYGSASIRGLGQAGDYGNRLLITADGATLNDPILYQSFISYDGRSDLGGIDRIEVVRGPGSVLYGTGAVSGIVNLIGDGLDAQDGGSATVGTFDNHVVRGRGDVHLKLSDKVGFQANVGTAVSQGRDEEVTNLDGEQVLLKAVEEFRALSTTGRVWAGDLTMQWYYSGRDLGIAAGPYGTTVNVPERNRWTDQRTMFEARYEPKLSEKVRLLTRAFFNNYAYDGLLPFDDDGFTSVENYRSTGGGLEARVIAEPSDKVRLQVGATAQLTGRLTLTGVDYEDVTDRTNGETYLDSSEPYQIGAGYALLDLTPIPEVRITGGARIDYWSTFGAAVSPRLAVVLVPTPKDVIKVLGGRAFRAPSPYELFYNQPGIQTTPESEGIELNPETVYSGEIEYSHAFDDVWTGLVSGHGSLASQLIDFDDAPSDPEAFTTINSEEQVRILGADFEVRRAFRGGWMVSGFYSLLDGRYAESGELLPNLANHNAGFKAIMPIALPTARVAYRASLEAPRRISRDADDKTGWAVVSDVVVSGGNPERGFEYAVGVYNLFNQSYQSPIAEGFVSRAFPQQGRSLMAELTFRL